MDDTIKNTTNTDSNEKNNKTINVDTKKSSLTGFAGFIETMLRHFRILAQMLLVLIIYLLMVR